MTDPQLEIAKQRMLRMHLKQRGIVDRRVLAAMAKAPRERFVDPEMRSEAYADRALPIGCQQTISQPYIVALMTQALELAGEETVLEIGTGSGYQTAVLAELVREVVTIERHAELSERAMQTLEALGHDNIRPLIGDGTQGCAERAPFDRIIVTAAASTCPPKLFEQLSEDGILVIPTGARDYQTLQAIRKTNGQPGSRNLSPCRFVPLIGGREDQ